MEAYLRTTGIGEENIFGTLAQTAAYRYGAPWLDALLDYLDETRKAVEESVRRLMPRCSVSTLEGTYLMWLDMREYGLEPCTAGGAVCAKGGRCAVQRRELLQRGERLYAREHRHAAQKRAARAGAHGRGACNAVKVNGF